MPTLAGLDGASLVPNTLDLLTRGAQAGQDFASRALTPDLLRRVQGGDQQALAELSQLNPEALQNLFAAQGQQAGAGSVQDKLQAEQLTRQIKLKSAQGDLQAQQLTQQVTQGRAEALETKGNLNAIMAGGAEGLRNNISKFVAKRGDTLTPEETREIVDIANLATTDPDAAFAQLEASLAGVDNDISIADQILRPPATGQAGFSAKTVAYNNGVSVQFDNRGNRRVTDASGQLVTGQDAVKAIRSGVDAGISEQASRAGSRAAAVADVKIKTERSLNAILADRKKGIDIAGAEADRLSGFISEGIEAVDALPKIDRGLELLSKVKTGGLTAKAKSVSDFFGTTSGDIGELNNILGQRVLDGLASFTGAISEGERAFIERMETGLKSGTGVNIRLLQQGKRMLERKIARARKAAEITQDDFSLDLFDNPQGLTLVQPAQPQTAQPQAQQIPEGATATNAQGQKIIMRGGQWQNQ